jgi:hypothetical protein
MGRDVLKYSRAELWNGYKKRANNVIDIGTLKGDDRFYYIEWKAACRGSIVGIDRENTRTTPSTNEHVPTTSSCTRDTFP